ncbi:InlB B-repeat-containing protein [Varibaculum massiliense]|uniref:InlB B-repeat-containing protein n=1 Tax=Varibaculum massiliense TaxID=1852372 RepID=UPI001F29E699|nr:InlB B-repeat-containing protein [Varibaculum massiliense]
MSNRKLREGLMLNFNNKPGIFLAEKSGGAIQQSASFLKRLLLVTLFCALSFMLSAPSLVRAEDLQEGTPAEQPSTNVQPVNTAAPAELIASAVPENKAPAKANTQTGDGLEIGPEIIGQPVRQSTLPAPKINDVFIGNTSISGGNLVRDRVGGKVVRATVYVTLKAKDGTVKATASVTPRSGTTWTVNLPAGVEVAEGDTVTAYQELNGNKSPVTDPVESKPSLAGQNKDKLNMPSGEIWIEQYVANIVNDDEKAEAIDLLKKANPTIAKDIKSVDFKINGVNTKTASYTVTYTDGSKSEEIQAPNLTIKQVTETSIGAKISDITVVDNVIKGKLQGTAPFDDIKVQISTKLSMASIDTFNSGKCTVDKNSDKPVEVSVNSTTGEFTYTIPGTVGLPRDQVVGVTVKEKNKFVSCESSTVILASPQKTEVRDPKKLTDDDKKAIDAAIRKANTINGTSKLPNGNPDRDGFPAVIQIDDSGNAKIFSGNDVAGTWDPNNDYKFVPETNDDGSYKLKDGAQPVITIPAKDLVKNIAPKSPVIKVDTDTGKVTIVPPAYKDPGDDTDLLSYTVTYKDADGNDKTITATRDLQTNKWSGPGVNEESGAITLSVEKIELAGTITATAKDNGGLEGDTDKLDSDPATKKLETATVSYNGNGSTDTMDGKKLNKGSKYKILDNKFKAPDDTQEFKAWEVDRKEVAAGTEITVTKDTVVKAVWKKIPVKVSYDANGGKGTMEGKTVDKGSEYTVLPNGFTAPDDTQEFDTWEVNGQKVAPGTKIKADKDTVIKAIWKEIEYKVNFDGNGGSGDMQGKTVKKGATVELPPNGFTPPSGKEFNGWQIDGNPHKVGESIAVNGDVTVKALWKDKPVPSSTTPGKGKPGNQAKPQNQNPAVGGNLSKTGANGMYSLYASLLLLATGGLFLISRRRRNQR